MVNQDERIFLFLKENLGKSFTAYFVSDIMLIPQPTVRRIFRELKIMGAIERDMVAAYENKNTIKYFTNESILTKYNAKMKKEKRRLQCRESDRKYKQKLRDQKNA
jgi:hypothetical protein